MISKLSILPNRAKHPKQLAPYYTLSHFTKTPHACIKRSKEQAKLHNQQTFESQNHLNNVLFYINKNSINNQIEAVFILLAMNLSIRAYLKEAYLFIVYLEELVGILLALQIAKDHS